MLVGPRVLGEELLRCLLKHVVGNEHIWVNFLSSYRIKRTLNAEMFLDHFFFIGVSALDDHRFVHQIVAYRTLQKVWHLKRPLVLLSVDVFCEIVIDGAWIIHSGSLCRELHCHKILVRLHFLFQIDHHRCFLICFHLALFVKLNFLCFEDLFLNLIFILSHFLTRAQRVGLTHALYSFIDLGTAAYVQFAQLYKRFTH